MVLGGLGLLDGKRATCYPGFEPELKGAQTTGESVVVDGNVTTGRGPGLVFDFALRLVEQIAGLATRQEVQTDCSYKNRETSWLLAKTDYLCTVFQVI